MPRFSYGSNELEYESYGTGGRTVVLLHGIMMDADVNRMLANELAKRGYRVHLLELLGHGRSDKPADISLLRMDQYGDQVAALLDHLGLERAIVGGVSLGAIVSLQVAVRHPKRVEALILEMPVLENAVPGIVVLLAPLLFAARFFPTPLRAIARAVRALPEGKSFVYRAIRSIFGNEPEAVAAILAGALVGPIAPTIGERRAILAPALVIGHRYDALHPFNDAEALATLMPNARFVAASSILEMRGSPARLLGLVESFLAALPTTNATSKAKLHA